MNYASFPIHYFTKKACRSMLIKSRQRMPFSPGSLLSTMTSRTQKLADSILLPDEADEDVIMQRRLALSRAITLIESRSSVHTQQADLLLNYVVQNTHVRLDGGKENVLKKSEVKKQSRSSFRVGIAGPPGAGKSSFIEAFGKYILDELPTKEDQSDVTKAKRNGDEIDIYQPRKVAVVCIDPSSTLTGGSILGDKTRMTELSRHPRCFVRPSPSKGVLGGISSYTNDVVTLCQASGYDIVVVETVGLGQSEVDISQTVDMLILMCAPGGGDGLQGVKKGILEMADMLIINKADGTLLPAARTTAADYKGATCFFRSKMEGWETPPVLLASAETGDGIPEIWQEICRYRALVVKNGSLETKRSNQARAWMWKYVQELIMNKIKSDENIKSIADEMENALDRGEIAPRAAASKLLDLSTKSIVDETIR